MRTTYLLACFAMLLCLAAAAEFNIQPYLYSGETAASVTYTEFQSQSGAAKLALINGDETFLLLDGNLLTDKAQISSILTEYYTKNFYPSQDDLSQLYGYAMAFNNSRNYMTRVGPSEKICLQYTFLSSKPCNDLSSCTQTATLLCYVTGSEGCTVDILATDILTYKKSVDKLNAAWDKFDAAYKSLGPSTLSASFSSMDDALSQMKPVADEIAQSKLRFPEGGASVCRDCLGICPDSHFDYISLSSARSKIASLNSKTAYFALLGTTVDKIAISTQQRQSYRSGEETAAIYQPKFDAAKKAFGGLKAQAEEAKALVSDSSFVSAANSFLDKEAELSQKMGKRDFSGFDALLSEYQSAGKALALVVNNSTAAYHSAADSQDKAGDAIIQAQWRVNRLSTASVDAYNSLAERKNKLDAQFKPPQTSTQYYALGASYENIATDSKAYVAASASFQDSVFGVGNTIGRASVDGAMGIASSMMPVSFQTRLSFAKYGLVFVVGAVDIAMLAAAIAVFVAAFYRFRGLFRSKLAVSGWVLTLLAFIFVLLIGSVGLYSIMANSDKFVSYNDFSAALASSSRAAVIIEQGGVADSTAKAMGACADSIEAQLRLQGKAVSKYYISGSLCSTVIPKAGNGSKTTYETKTGLAAADCLNSIPDVPVFDLQYSKDNQPPTFTTVVTKSAIIKGNEAYYGKSPMCDPANVLG